MIVRKELIVLSKNNITVVNSFFIYLSLKIIHSSPVATIVKLIGPVSASSMIKESMQSVSA